MSLKKKKTWQKYFHAKTIRKKSFILLTRNLTNNNSNRPFVSVRKKTCQWHIIFSEYTYNNVVSNSQWLKLCLRPHMQNIVLQVLALKENTISILAILLPPLLRNKTKRN